MRLPKIAVTFLAIVFCCRPLLAVDPPPTAAAPPAASAASTPAAAVTGGEFSEMTRIIGTPPADLNGIWLLNAEFVITKDNYKNIAQLLKITNGKDGPEFHILDVDLPPVAQAELTKANDVKPRSRWVPSPDALKAIADQWQKLPRRQIRGPADNVYGEIEFFMIAADQYATAIAQRDPQTDKILEGTKFVMMINEKYKPQELRDNRIAPLITRRSIYGVRTIEKDVLKGDQIGGFVSTGAGRPLPISVGGQFGMYRVAAEKE